MTFIWPPMLLSLALIPIGVLLYWIIDRRRRRLLPTFGGPEPAQGRSRRLAGLRRRIPPALMLCGLVVMSVALGRPQAVVGPASRRGHRHPRLRRFRQHGRDRSDAHSNGSGQGRGKGLRGAPAVGCHRRGRGLQRLGRLDSDAPQTIRPRWTLPSTGWRRNAGPRSVRASSPRFNVIAQAEAGPWANDYYSNQSPAPSPTATPTPVASGTHDSAVIVLLSDGENNESPDPLAAAQTAADRGVRIYTVGVGSSAGTSVTVSGFQVHTQLDQATLQGISQVTGGSYYSAADSQQLRSIYDNLDTQLVIQPQMTEITRALRRPEPGIADRGRPDLARLAGSAAMTWRRCLRYLEGRR